MMDPRMMQELGLTDTQREQIRALHEQARTDSQPFQEQMKTIHDSIRQLIEGKQFDEATARTLTKQQAEIESELAFIRVRTDASIFRLLTDEQRTKLEEMRRQGPPQPPPPGQGGNRQPPPRP
jgi:Spy/CpxP family protein refolding chaperone